MTLHPERHLLTSADGLALAVRAYGDPGRPTLVAIHGYPDDQRGWEPLAAALGDAVRLVSYDVRGAGESEAPPTRAGYRMEHLLDDLRTVLDWAGATNDHPVHLIGHDWGSIQGWHAICEPDIAARVASYTSISGPHLAMAARWLRHGAGHRRAALRQLRRSAYIVAFCLPRVGEAMVRRGIVARASGRTTDERTAINGLELYRANIGRRWALPEVVVSVPVTVLAPAVDSYVTAEWQHGAPAGLVERLECHQIEGNHWVISNSPAQVAAHLREL